MNSDTRKQISHPDTAIVILAAGSSSRLGSPKQLLAWGDKTLLEHAIDEASLVEPRHIVVILGASHELIRSKTNRKKVDVVINDDWQIGMGTSIAKGMSHIIDNQLKIKNALIMLCDQPAIDYLYLQRLLITSDENMTTITATSYDGKPGVPAVFDRKYFDTLIQLKNKGGAKQLLNENIKDVTLFSPGLDIQDIDTEEDYHRLIEMIQPQKKFKSKM